MLFRQLEYFVALARERHFARAAAACYVSQPALSAALAKLEQELGVPLIYRDHTFQGLTPEGERLVIWARRILAEQDALRLEVQAMRSGITGRLRLGTPPSASTTAAFPVEAFCARHPLATVRLSTRLSAPELARMLRAFELDAAISYAVPGEYQDLEVVPLYRERYQLVAPAAFVPAGADAAAIGWREAADLPLALLAPHLHAREILDAAFADAGVEAKAQVETDSIATLHTLVRSGSWGSIVPSAWLAALGPLPADLRVIPLPDPAVPTQISVIIAGGAPVSPIARAFADTAAALRLDELFESLVPPVSDLA
ncbi:MAG TPA: LysR family transcriptional regulator [Gryllotalpicola sp.]